MNTTTLDTTSTKNNTQANQNDFLEVVTREYGRVSDLFDTTDQTTISINSFGRQVLRE